MRHNSNSIVQGGNENNGAIQSKHRKSETVRRALHSVALFHEGDTIDNRHCLLILSRSKESFQEAQKANASPPTIVTKYWNPSPNFRPRPLYIKNSSHTPNSLGEGKRGKNFRSG
jgi:hypothetical protein